MKEIKRKTFIISPEAHNKLFKLYVVNEGKKSYSRIINDAITAYYEGIPKQKFKESIIDIIK